MFTTSNIGQVFPDIQQQYGTGKNLDLIFSFSKDLFVEGIPDAKPTGMQIDKNGVVKINANIPLQMTVEHPGKQWEAIRNIYVTV